MALNILTTDELFQQNISRFESKLSQTVPTADKAFIRILSVILALNSTSMYKFGAERAIQNLALTATGSDLDLLGNEYEVPRKLAEAAILTATLPALTGTVIPATSSFIGDSNGVRYFPDASVIAVAGIATLTLTAQDSGVIGNLNISDTLQIDSQISGAENIATVTAIVNTGAEEEEDDAYRLRVLDKIRAQGGGGNLADYREWSQEVAGVFRAYPYSGQPLPASSSPPERSVFVEADTTIDPDGIAPPALLDQVRDSITTDPETGLARQPLGLTDATLWVESITRKSFYIDIEGFSVDASVLAQVKLDIASAIETYLRKIKPFIAGLDVSTERNDKITAPVLSNIVQDIVSSVGGSFTDLIFSDVPAGDIAEYTLAQGETVKTGSITYTP